MCDIPVIIIAIGITTNIIIYIRKPSAIVRTIRLFCLDIIFRCWPAQTSRIINLIITIFITTVGMSAKNNSMKWLRNEIKTKSSDDNVCDTT